MSDEENLRKIMMMGFADEDDIRAVLKSCSSDVNEALSVLASEGIYSKNNVAFTPDKGSNDDKQLSEGEFTETSGTILDESTSPLDKLVKGHDISHGFTSFEFNRLQSRIYTEQWDIPCLRSQSLGLCLLGTIHEIRLNGLKTFDLYPEAQRFLTGCLKECVTKLMTSQAVFNWDRDTLEGVHNMLELIIRLICEYMAVLKVTILEEMKEGTDDDTVQTSSVKNKRIQSLEGLKCRTFLFTETFQLLSMIFDCETNYHQLCRDRNSNTGTYADPFNDWSQISRQHMGDIVFAETLPTPRNFYLVSLLNCFGVYNGFSLLSWFATQPWSNINLTSIFLLPMAKCTDYLTLYTMENYAAKIMYRVIWRLSNLNAEDFKDRDSRIFELITSVRVLTYRLIDLNVADKLGSLLTTQECNSCLDSLMFTIFEPDWEEVISRYRKSRSESSTADQISLFSIPLIDKLHYSVLLSAISPPQGAGGATFNGRIMALRELVQQIEIAKQFGNSNTSSLSGLRNGQKRTRPSVPLTSASLLATENVAFLAKRQKRRVLRLDQLMSWIQDNEVIAKSLHKLDNTAYMATLSNFFRSLGERITNDDLTTLWHRTSHQNGAAVDNILNLLTDLSSSRFTQSQLKHLFFLVELSWMNLDLQALAQVPLGIKSSDSAQANGRTKSACISSPPPDEPSTIRHARARLLNMIGRIGITTKDPNTADMCIELLWRLAHSNYSEEAKEFSKSNHSPKQTPQKMSFVERILVPHVHKADHHPADSDPSPDTPKYMHPEPIEAALAQQLVIIREFHCSGVDQRIRAMRWLLEAMGYISKNSLTFFMLAYVKSLLEFILKNFIGKAKRDHLHELNRSYELITRVVDSLLHYEKWAISSHGDLLTADSLDELGFRHSDVIKRHFDLLHYLLRNAELTLSVERAKALWETLIGQTRAAPFDREQAFIWFSSCLNFLDTDAQTFVFTKVILKSNPALFRSIAGFECFKGFFEKVNLNEGRMKQVAKSWHVERPDLIGLEFLWDLYLALPSSDASLDGGHSNRPVEAEATSTVIDATTGNKSSLGDSSKNQSVPAVISYSVSLSSSSTSSAATSASPSTALSISAKSTPDAAKPARLLLLNVHWGQLAPKLRRDPESCYRRFFDTCRRRLEANYALGRGLVTEYGVTSVLAETGELLAALMLGIGPATKAKHCSRTAAKLAIRRLLGLVYAFIQSVEDEMFGSRTQHPNWKPHGCTYRGWDMPLLVKVETVKQGQSSLPTNNPSICLNQTGNKLSSSNANLLGDSYQYSDLSDEPILLLAHSNEPLSSIRDRAYLASSAYLFAFQSQSNYRQDNNISPSWTAATLSLEKAPEPKVCSLSSSSKEPVVKTMLSHDMSSQRNEIKSAGREKSSQPLDTVLNRMPIGELGFQVGRHLIVRFYAESNSRSRSRISNTSVVSSVATPLQGMSNNSLYSSSFSLAGAYLSTLELTNEGLNNPTNTVSNRYTLAHDESTGLLSSFRKRLEIPSIGSNLMSRGSSILSLNAKQSLVDLSVDLSNTNQSVSTNTSSVNTVLPSICLGQDSAVYELLFELAESELFCLNSQSGKKLHSSSTGTTSGAYFSSTFSFIHPVRLLLACLPTFKSLRYGRNGSGSVHSQYNLVCNPYTLLNSSPYRVLYKLQLLSSALIPVDSTPWWETSPGCLLSPPSVTYFINYPFQSKIISRTYKPMELISMGSNVRSNGTVRRSSHTRLSPDVVNEKESKADWFLSVDAIHVSSQMTNSTSAPSSPVLSSRRSLKVFSSLARANDVFSLKGKSQKHATKDLSMVADAPLIEYLETLVQLLERNLTPFFNESPCKTVNACKKHISPFPLIFRSHHTHRHLDTSEGEFLLSNESHNTAMDNANWWRREIRHLCLQMIASLLNPITVGDTNNNGSSGGNNNTSEFTTAAHNSYQRSVTPELVAVLPADALVYQIPPLLAMSLLNTLLETALVSAGIDTELLDHTHARQASNLSLASLHSVHRSNMFLSHVDSRSGVAGIIETVSYLGRQVLFQDVEISVQCIRLYFQCIIAYPCVFVNVLLKSVNLESKFIQLLVYSPSERVRNEMARQLEQLCILVSPYLYTGAACFPMKSTSNSTQCSLHSYIRNPEILNLLLKTILHSPLPFFDVKFDLMTSPTASILISQCAEYFRVRGFLLGQTPAQVLKRNFNTDHITILQNDISWFRNMMDFDRNLNAYKVALSDCLLAGHLNSIRLICAQAVACVSSHFLCTFNSGSGALTTTSTTTTTVPPPPTKCLKKQATLIDQPASGLNSFNYSRKEFNADSSQLLPPVQLLEALAKTDLSMANESDNDLYQSTVSNEFTETVIPIHSSVAMKIATQALYLSRDFICYLVVECLFPAARYLLSDQTAKELSALLNASKLTSQKCSKRERLRRTLSALFRHCNLPQLDVFKNCQSLEKLVNLLILLHHSHKPDQIGTGAGVLSTSLRTSETTFDPGAYHQITDESSSKQHHQTENLVGKAGVHWDVQPIVAGRAECGFVGLRNGGATCYMNSVLQQLFMQPGVAEALLAITDADDTDEKNILFQTQRLFGHLLESQLEYYDPVGFWKSFRPWSTNVEVNPFEQQDAFDFFQALIDQLDDALKRMKREPFFQALYQGIFLDSKFCDECDHRYDREEVFSAINLAVKANDLYEALNQFVRGEVLEGDNAYYCERCCVKRRAVKRLSIHTLPPVLCLHLKRFDFDWDRQIPVKFSHYFKFPRQLDMSPYLTGSVQKFRSAAFFSPHSSTSALLQREAKESRFSQEPQNNEKIDGKDLTDANDNKSTNENTNTKSVVTFSNSPSSSPPSSPKETSPVEEQCDGDIGKVEMKSNSLLNNSSALNAPLSSYKKSSDDDSTENIYKLVGVVVHSGQANSGHYYSFIKDRRRCQNPTNSSVDTFDTADQVNANTASHQDNTTTTIINQSSNHGVQTFEKSNLSTISENQIKVNHNWPIQSNQKDTENWYRFNDTCVEPVQLTDELLEHECFGGTYKVTGNDGRTIETRTRYWSAYLLFYERSDLHYPTNKQTNGSTEDLSSNQQTADLQMTNENKDEGRSDSHLPNDDQTQLDTASNSQCNENDLLETSALTVISKTKSIPMPTRIAQQIWTENMTFLRDQNIYSREYFQFIRDLCEGILTDVSSLRQEPERSVLGTKLMSHFLFNTFFALHPRVKLSMALNCTEPITSLSTTSVSEMSTKLISELLGLLTRLAASNPSAARCLMHFLYVSPNQPCLVSMLLDPKPVARQQTASMILAVLQGFYSFKETNILDGALTEAGALFAMLRGYAEMCPHATVHLSNLKATKRLLNFFIDSNVSNSMASTEPSDCNSSFTGSAPDWTHKLRVWSPAQQREMGNLYYLLTILLRQTSFDAYRIPDTPSLHDAVPAHPPLAYRQTSQSRLLLRPQKETVLWLGLSIPPLTNRVLQPPVSQVQPTTSDNSSTTKPYSTQLVGLFRLCEVLLKAYIDNPVIPSLNSSLVLGDIGNQVFSVYASSATGSGASTTTMSNSGSVSAAGLAANSSDSSTLSGSESLPLRQRIRELMIHLSANSWDASQCFIVALLDRLRNRPQSELRQYFDLLGELLRLTDSIQPARIVAVIDGLINQKVVFSNNKWIWSPRPNGDRTLWAWSKTETNDNDLYSNDSNSQNNDQETNEYGPPQVQGLLDLIHEEHSQDPRRAYQCTKFIVELSSQNSAVVKYLSNYPEKWEPIVKWLQNLMESENSSSSRKSSLEVPNLCRYDSVDNQRNTASGESDGFYIDVPTGLISTRKPGSHMSGDLIQASNEYGETSAGFQRTVSAQTTLREATRLLSTMPRSNNPEPKGLSSPLTPLMMSSA
uniref:UBA domain-containing protein n=2 Tax=Trichobilharzia regenti TaxID=157069 RepID=A0AA85JHW3_TRIRE